MFHGLGSLGHKKSTLETGTYVVTQASSHWKVSLQDGFEVIRRVSQYRIRTKVLGTTSGTVAVVSYLWLLLHCDKSFPWRWGGSVCQLYLDLDQMVDVK